MNFVSAILVRFFILLFALVPFWLLYIFSDILYFFIYKVFKYRVNTVRDNLSKCFPDKSRKELLRIEKLSYRNLSEITVEGLKAFTMTKKQIYKRHKVINEEDISYIYKNCGGIISVAFHYTNWEWGALSCMQLNSDGVALYKPLANKYLDKYLKKNRSRTGAELVSIYETARYFQANANKKKNFILAADQSPSNSAKSYWVNFFGRDTAFLHGPEVYSKKYHYPVILIDIQRVRRGYYELELSMLSEEPWKLEDGELTKILANKLEDIIRKKPQDWLWTHRRWKLSR